MSKRYSSGRHAGLADPMGDLQRDDNLRARNRELEAEVDEQTDARNQWQAIAERHEATIARVKALRDRWLNETPEASDAATLMLASCAVDLRAALAPPEEPPT